MKNEKSNMSGSKLTGAEISTYFRKNPKAKAVKKAVEIALDHGGAMTYAIKTIEKLKKGLSNHPEVKKALRYANESVTYKESLNTVYNILSENYTRNFDLLCNSIKLNKVQQKILDQFINHGTIKNQYVGRVAGTKKEKSFYAAKKAYKGSIENRNEALMKALKVNATQKNILDAYLKTGKVIGKYAGSIAGSTKSTKSYSAFRGFKEHFEIEESVNEAVGRAIKLDWDMGDPREYAADWKDVGVYLDHWDPKKHEIEVSGKDMDLQMWLTDEDEGYGMSTKDAAKLIRKGKRVRL